MNSDSVATGVKAADVKGTHTTFGPAVTNAYGGGGYDPKERMEEVPYSVTVVYTKYGVIITPFIPLLLFKELTRKVALTREKSTVEKDGFAPGSYAEGLHSNVKTVGNSHDAKNLDKEEHTLTSESMNRTKCRDVSFEPLGVYDPVCHSRLKGTSVVTMYMEVEPEDTKEVHVVGPIYVV